MKEFEEHKKILPAFPRTKHLPYDPNASSGDLIATLEEAETIFSLPVNIEEKIDGASVGICLHPELGLIIRNRDHVLRKGYYKETGAKEQFRSIWNWYYENEDKFKTLNQLGSYAVYGEWCIAQHGVFYNRLPDWFVAYDLYDYELKKFISPTNARFILEGLKFATPYKYKLDDFKKYSKERIIDYLKYLTRIPGAWSNSTETTTNEAEGIYLKTYDEKFVINRFKMVNPTFVRGALWNSEKIKKNVRARKTL